ncbi:MAG: sugar phosphate permease [Dehalococcoidales bacterium]|nr:sugar phosphate permease [Dehalococcoidales bacterium]
MVTRKVAITGSQNRYGYVVVVFSFLIQAIGLSLITGFGLFFNPMLAEFGWSRATISAASTINAFSSGLASIPTGILNDRFGPRIVMAIYGIIFGLGFILISRVNSPWQLYLAFGVAVGIGMTAINIVLLSTIARWFATRRSMMTALVKAGAGVGIFIMPFIITALIQNSGWRKTTLFLGVASLAIMVISAQFLRRAPVQEETPLNSEGQSNHAVIKENESGLSFREASKTRQFWLVCLAFAAFTYSFQTVQLHIVPYAEDSGISAASAAVIISIIGIVSIAGRLALGYIGDKWGTKQGFIFVCLILMTALVWLLTTRGLTMLYLFAGIYGMFHGGLQTIISPVVASLFGTRNMGSIFGATSSFGTIIGSLGGFLTGYFYDRLGSYTVAFLVCLGLAILGLVALLFIQPVLKGQSVKS